MKTHYLAAIHFVCAMVALFAFMQIASWANVLEPFAVGKGKVVAWIGFVALLVRTMVFVFLQHTRFRAQIDRFSHPYGILAAVGIVDGLLLIPLFSLFGFVYYSSVSDPAVESIFLVLLGPIASLAVLFPLALNGFLMLRQYIRRPR